MANRNIRSNLVFCVSSMAYKLRFAVRDTNENLYHKMFTFTYYCQRSSEMGSESEPVRGSTLAASLRFCHNNLLRHTTKSTPLSCLQRWYKHAYIDTNSLYIRIRARARISTLTRTPSQIKIHVTNQPTNQPSIYPSIHSQMIEILCIFFSFVRSFVDFFARFCKTSPDTAVDDVIQILC